MLFNPLTAHIYTQHTSRKVDNYEVKSSEIELKIELRHRKRYGLDREKHFQCGPAVFVERNRISYEFQFQKKKVF